MLIKRIAGTTRVLGVSQGYLGLPVRDAEDDFGPYMMTAWEPTPADVENIAGGGEVYLVIRARGHPPVQMGSAPLGHQWTTDGRTTPLMGPDSDADLAAAGRRTRDVFLKHAAEATAREDLENARRLGATAWVIDELIKRAGFPS